MLIIWQPHNLLVLLSTDLYMPILWELKLSFFYSPYRYLFFLLDKEAECSCWFICFLIGHALFTGVQGYSWLIDFILYCMLLLYSKLFWCIIKALVFGTYLYALYFNCEFSLSIFIPHFKVFVKVVKYYNVNRYYLPGLKLSLVLIEVFLPYMSCIQCRRSFGNAVLRYNQLKQGGVSSVSLYKFSRKGNPHTSYLKLIAMLSCVSQL